MPVDSILIVEPILGYRLVFKKADYVFLNQLVKTFNNEQHSYIMKSINTKTLLLWMYKNAILILK